MACDRYEEYVGDGSQEHLKQLKEDVIRDITEVLGIKPQFGIPDNELFNRKHSHLNKEPHFIVTSDGVTPRFFEGSARLIEINDLTWRYHGNRRFPWHRDTRGEYIYEVGVIFLHKPMWCRHTIVHEVLHGTSVFSRLYEDGYPEFRSHKFLREGITDTLTGYILNQRCPQCYDAWRRDLYPQCAIAGYKKRVQLWCSLCRHIGLEGVVEFYLSGSDTIAKPWNQLQEAVKDKGFPDFNYPLDKRTPYNENVFREMVFKSVPNFRDVYREHQKNLDFTQLSL